MFTTVENNMLPLDQWILLETIGIVYLVFGVLDIKSITKLKFISGFMNASRLQAKGYEKGYGYLILQEATRKCCNLKGYMWRTDRFFSYPTKINNLTNTHNNVVG